MLEYSLRSRSSPLTSACCLCRVDLTVFRQTRLDACISEPASLTLFRTRKGVTSLNPFRTIVLVASTYFSNRDGRTWRSLASSRVAAHDSTKGFHPMSSRRRQQTNRTARSRPGNDKGMFMALASTIPGHAPSFSISRNQEMQPTDILRRNEEPAHLISHQSR